MDDLIGNALDAIEDGTGRQLTLRTHGEDSRVVVEVIDDGPGYPPEVADRLFDPFFTTKAPGKGTGLGLHTVWRAVVDLHGGTIESSSRPEHTCFRVALPVRLPRT